MDLNELLKQHQIALMNAKDHHFDGMDQGFCMVRHYARRIARLRSELGVRHYQKLI